jgi:hypothetical protein
MDSNTHSNQPPEPPAPPELSEPPDGLAGLPELSERWEQPPGRPAGLGFLTAADQELAAEDLDQLTDAALTQQTVELQQALDRLAGHWLRRLAAVDARGAAGADQGQRAASTAGWLRHRLRMGAGAAREAVRCARALFRGPLPQTAQALTAGAISPAHAQVLAQGTRHLPDHIAAEAEPVLDQAARRLDPPRLRRAVGHLLAVADPDAADQAAQRRHDRRGLRLASTWDGMVAVDGLLEPEAGQLVQAALEPLARPAEADDPRNGWQRNADALAELCRRALEAGRPRPAGSAPSCWSPSTSTASSAIPTGLVATWAGPGRWIRRAAGGWPATGPSPGWWSAASMPATSPAPIGCMPPSAPAPTSAPPATTTQRRADRRRPHRAPAAAADGPGPAAPDPGWRPQPASRGRPGDPGDLPGPAGRLDGA